MSWVSVYIHMVFSTKNREPLLNSADIRKEIFQHIKENAEKKDICIDCVSGYQEHAHCLISLHKEHSISKVAQLIKGESSFWINQNKLTTTHFNWQDDYWAVGISQSHLPSVRAYIHNQEIHHAQQSFADEINRFMDKYGWSFMKGNE